MQIRFSLRTNAYLHWQSLFVRYCSALSPPPLATASLGRATQKGFLYCIRLPKLAKANRVVSVVCQYRRCFYLNAHDSKSQRNANIDYFYRKCKWPFRIKCTFTIDLTTSVLTAIKKSEAKPSQISFISFPFRVISLKLILTQK